MKRSELRTMIAQIVSEELRKQLPGVISEMYLRKLTVEAFAVKHGRSRLREVMQGEEDDEEEETPRPIPNDDQGIFKKNPLVKESSNPLRDGPLAEFYEGTSPLSEMEGKHSEGLPIEKLGDFSAQRALMEKLEHRGPKSSQASMDMKMRELEERRRALEVPAVVLG